MVDADFPSSLFNMFFKILLHLKKKYLLEMSVISFPSHLELFFSSRLCLVGNFMIYMPLHSECENYKCLPPCLTFIYKTFKNNFTSLKCILPDNSAKRHFIKLVFPIRKANSIQRFFDVHHLF